MAQAMIVPIAMSTEVDLVPVLDMVPLDHLPPFSLPSEADLLRLLHGKSPQPCQIKNRKSRCSDEGGCEEKGEKCVLRKMKESWAQKGLPLKERDDEIVNIFSKVKQRLQSLKKNVKKMSSQTKEKRHNSRRGRRRESDSVRREPGIGGRLRRQRTLWILFQGEGLAVGD